MTQKNVQRNVQRNVLFATASTCKTRADFDAVCKVIRGALADEGHGCGGIYWGYGPGCTNLCIGVLIEDKGEGYVEQEVDRFGGWLYSQLGPMTKWCLTSDPIEEGDVCDLF